MGPYVTEIVNTFSVNDDVYYFFHDYVDDFFRKNVKKELMPKSVFYKRANSAWNKLVDLITDRSGYDSLVLRMCEEHNIQLVHYINGIPTLRMQKKFEARGITVLSTVHDLYPHEAKKAWYKMMRQRIIYQRLNRNLQTARYLVTNSMEQYSTIKKLFPDKELTYHSFPSLVSKEIQEGRDTPSELSAIDKPYILFFGRIEEYKGVHLLYKAFTSNKELYDNYTLVIAGRGDVAFTRSADEKNVIMVNRYIKDTEVASLYQNAHCVVYPYISATQSGVLSLAFYFQTPVLASDVPFFKSIIEPSSTGMLFKTGDALNLAQQLLKLVKADTVQMMRNQAKYYSEQYDGAAIRDSLLKIYSMQWTEEDCLSHLLGGG